MTTYTLLKPIRVWRQHRTVRKQLAELAMLERRAAVHQGFYQTI